MAKKIDLIGSKIARLTIIRSAGTNYNGAAQWFCKCDCGTWVIALGVSLRSGNKQSCGCLRKELNQVRNLSGVSNDRRSRAA